MRHAPSRALVAGLANTVFGLAVIAIAMGLGASSFVANLTGYAAGWGLSFLLNRHYVFANTHGGITGQGFRFIGAVAASYGANLCVLALATQVLGFAPLVAQVLAMATYTACLFVICQTFVFSAKKISNDMWVLLATTTMAVGSFFAVANSRLTHDVVWQLWIARQIANGTRLYTDIIEINPPLWFWMGLAIHKIAALIDSPPALILKVAIIGWAALAVLLADSVNERAPLKSRLTIALASFVIIAILPGYDFGQREQITLIATLPYAALIGSRTRGREAALIKALLIGLLAACGIALKHYFIAVPLALELFLLFHLRRDYRPIRPETVTLVLSACGYAAAVMAFTPEFLTEIVPLVDLAYDGYQNSIVEQLIGPHQVVIYAVILAVFLHRDVFAVRSTNVLIYLISAASFSIAYFAQQKGWQYHAIPISGFLMLALTSCSVKALQRGVRLRAFPVGIAALVLAVFASFVWIGPYRSGAEDDFDLATNHLSPGDTVFTASTGPRMSWPMVEERGLRWPSRYFALWTTGATVLTPRSDPRHASLEKLARKVRSDTYHDLICNPPKVIMIEDPLNSRKLRTSGFTYLDFLRKSEDLDVFLDNYKYRGTAGGLLVYDRSDDARIYKKPADCRTIF